MIQYFQEGGWSMWAILLTAIVTSVVAGMRSGKGRASALWAGGIVAIAQGLLGISQNLATVSRYCAAHPGENLGELIGQGIGESSHAGTFAAGVALLLGLAGYVFHLKAERE
jgi:hypothetical protein